MKLSLVIPCYNEEGNVRLMYDAVRKVFDEKNYSYEMIFVNDGSRDSTYKELKKIYSVSEFGKVKIINFSRNFGKEAAILAGLKHSKGDYITLIDADLQQRPEIAADMVAFLDENESYDCVAAYQEQRKENAAIAAVKGGFYKFMNKISETDFVNGASDFRTMRRSMCDAILDMPEYHRFSKGIFSWVGFETYYMPYVVEERASGKSKWSFWSLFKYAVSGIIAFSTFPLKLSTFAGLTSAICAIIYAFVVVFQKIFFSIDVPGYATIVVLLLLLGGLQLFALGVVGEYISKIYIQVKNRPAYIIKEVLGDE